MSSLDNSNPYQSPHIDESSLQDGSSDQRSNALFLVRWTIVMLLIPGAWNFYCFHFVRATHRLIFNDGYIIHPNVQWLFACVNFVLSAGLIAFVWFAGLKTLDCVGVVAHHLFAEEMPQQQWLASMYDSLWPLKWIAPVGAVSWMLWLYLYFYTNFQVIVINLALGGFGHILALLVYGNIFYRWYRLRGEHKRRLANEISI